jgi:two-component system invasion response regulator UvrY
LAWHEQNKIDPTFRVRNATMKIRFLIVDDHVVVRRGVIQILAEHFKQAEFGEASSAHEALEQIWKGEWNLVILDISLPGRSGLDALKELKQARPGIPVLILSMHTEDEFALRAIKGGASGYLTKETIATELVAASEKALAGGEYIRPSIADKLVSFLRAEDSVEPHHSLSNREYQVLTMIAAGKTVKEMGAELSMSVKTISTYRTRMLEKMRMKNDAELIRYALQHKLVA